MTSNRSLTEELQSVLRAHSLDAPEPSGAIEDILARTIAADSSDEQPSPRSRPRVLRLLLRPAIVGVAASVAFVLVGVAVVNATRDNGSGGGTASLSEGSPATASRTGPGPRTSACRATRRSPAPLPSVPGPRIASLPPLRAR